MSKDFDAWNSKKQLINSRTDAPFYHEREIWWCSLGVNVGFEQDGGESYNRPVLIIKGFSPEVCFVVALTGRIRHGKYYLPIGKIEERDASIILSQVKLIDTKRLLRKMGTLNVVLFNQASFALQRTLFGKG